MDNKKPKKKPVGPNGINIVQPGPHGPMPESAPVAATVQQAGMSPYHDSMCSCASCTMSMPAGYNC